jgi:peptidylprolyl isomerase
MTTTATTRAAPILLALLAGAGACSEREASAPTPAPQTPPPQTPAPEFDWRSVLAGDPIESRDLGDGLLVHILSVGEAAAPVARAGDTAEIEFRASHFTADAAPVEFDSSAKRGGPLRVPLTDGSAVPGLLRGLEGLRVGDVARIEIPANLGYGAAGRGPIPGNAALVFEVWVRDVTAD